jgi:hypothetical protein
VRSLTQLDLIRWNSVFRRMRFPYSTVGVISGELLNWPSVCAILSTQFRMPFGRFFNQMKPGLMRRPFLLTALALTVFWTECYSPAFAQDRQPLVAIHDSELTRALENIPASGATPTGAGTTGKEWWPTNWHYFVMPESLKETLRSDGTAFAVVGDSNIVAGELLTNGVPKYPILISLAAEAIRDDEIAPLTNYVAAGGFLVVGSSSFTRNTNGASRGDFALAAEMGIHCFQPSLTNWAQNNYFSKQADHRIISHVPGGALTWRMPSSSEEIPFGTSPTHQYLAAHSLWQVVSSNATLLAQGDSFPYLLVKPYGNGYFIYCAAMQPLMGYGGWSPGMYAYGIFRESIEWAFEAARLPVAKLSPWPYAYDAAFIIRHDFENYQIEIANIESSAQFENSLGAKGDYYFCTGTLKHEITNAAAAIAGLQRAVTNYNATIGSHNGGFRNPGNLSLNMGEFDYWHWGPDEALDLMPTNFANGKEYALASISNSFVDIETWLAGINTGPRAWVGCYFNAVREDSLDIQEQLNIKIAGERKLGPFPHWTLSTQTSGKRYSVLSQPLSDWFVGSQVIQIAQSLEYHTSETMRAGVDYYYGQGALINFYSHILSTGVGAAGSLASEYVTYCLNTNLHPRVWSANAVGIYEWWVQRSNVQFSVSHNATNGNHSITTITIGGSGSTNTAIELCLPAAGIVSGLEVLTNGVTASGDAYRTNGRIVKVRVGAAVTNVVIDYHLLPMAQGDYYSVASGGTLAVPAAGVLANDAGGYGGSNLTAVLVSNIANGTLFLTNNGGFTYNPTSNFFGSDLFTYMADDGISNSAPTSVLISVTPVGTLFFDDFFRLPGSDPLSPWTAAMVGTWVITNGVLRGVSAAQSYGYAYISNSWADYSVEASIQHPAGAFGGGIGGRLNPANGAHYAAWIYPEGSPGGSSLLKLVKYTGWTSWSGTPMATASLPGVGTSSHLVKIFFQGNRIRVFYDGVQIVDVLDNNFSGVGAYMSGGIVAGMWTYLSPYNMTVDDVLVAGLSSSPPVAVNDAYNAIINTPLVVAAPGVLANDTGGNGTLSAILVSNPTNGLLTLNSNGGFTFTPNTGFVGTDAFTYRASDGLTNSSPATVTITTSPVNSTPIAVNDVFSVAASLTQVIHASGVLFNDTDADDDPLAAVLASSTTNGLLTLSNNGGFVYFGATNFVGMDAFTYRANDGVNTSGVATVTVLATLGGELFSDDFDRVTNSLSPWTNYLGNWSITNGALVGGINTFYSYGFAHLPANWASYAVEGSVQFPAGAFGGGLGGRLNTANGAHYAAWVYPEGSAGGSKVLKLVKFQSATTFGYNAVNNGAAMTEVSLPSVDTSPHTVKLAFHGNRIALHWDGVLMTNVTDADTAFAPYTSGGITADFWTHNSTYNFTVDNISVRPLVADDSYSVNENSMLSASAPGVLDNDSTVYAANLTAMLLSGPAHGALDLSTNGGFTYTPETNFSGADGFCYYTVNGGTNLGAAVVNITVNPTSAPPPVIQSLTLTSGVVTVVSTSVTGRTYRLQRKDTVLDVTWTDVSPDVPATGSTVTLNDSVGSATQRFYRVILLP